MKRLFFFSFRGIGLLLAVCLLSAPLAAGDASPALTLEQAIARTLTGNPELESYSYAIRAAEAEKLQAGLRPNPDIMLQLEDIGGSGELRGARSTETTLQISQVLELGGKRQQRINRAAMRSGLVGDDYDIKRLDVTAETARRFVHVIKDQLLLELAGTALELEQQIQAAVRDRVEAARAMRMELDRADIAVARAQLEVEHREHELASSRRYLAATWGGAQADFGQAAGDLFAFPAVAGIEQLLEELRFSPDIRRLISERRLRAAELALANARATPDARVGLGLRRLEQVDEQALMLNFSMGVPLTDRNQGNIQAARARLDRMDSQEQAAYIRAQAMLYATYQELRHALTEASMIEDELLDAARRIMRDSNHAYQAGRLSYLELADARNRYIGLRREAIMAAADYHRLLIEIERLTGRDISAAGGQS